MLKKRSAARCNARVVFLDGLLLNLERLFFSILCFSLAILCFLFFSS